MAPIGINSEPLLTIAIPTYNRSKYLDLCLSSIFSQEEINSGFFRVIVSDNCSSDDTFGVVEKYRSKKFPVQYCCTTTNIGAPKNVLRCYELADTKYVLILGDDDLLLKGALAKISNVLCSDNYGVVYLNSYFYANSYIKEKPKYSSKGVVAYSETFKFFRDVNFMLTFISANIFNKELMPSEESVNRFDTTLLPQLAWIIPIADKADKNARILDYCVAAKKGNTGGYPLCEVFGNSLNSIFEYYQNKGIPKAYFDAVNKELICSFFPINLIVARDNQKFKSEDQYGILKELYGDDFMFWICVVPVIKLPLPLAKAWGFILRVVRRVFRKLKKAF